MLRLYTTARVFATARYETMRAYWIALLRTSQLLAKTEKAAVMIEKQCTKDAIQIVAPVIANPQGEAIQCIRMDCFTLRVRNDEAAGRLYQSPFSRSVLLKCSVFFPMTIQDLHFATI